MVCVSCFHNEGLRRVASSFTSAAATTCHQCGAFAPPLTAEQVEEAAFEFFINGSIPARSQFGTEQFRILDCDNGNEAAFKSSLATDCDLLRRKIGIRVCRYEPSPLWRIGCGDIQLALSVDGKRTAGVLNEIVTSVPAVVFPIATVLYRIRLGRVSPDSAEFDPPPTYNREQHGRFDSRDVDILYTSLDIETCLHEARVAIADDITLATLHTLVELKLADLTAFPDNVDPHNSLQLLSRTFSLGGENHYPSCRQVAASLRSAGFDGFVYESHFSLVKPNAPKNVALFGRPLGARKLALTSVNGIVLRKVKYSFSFGPAPDDDTDDSPL